MADLTGKVAVVTGGTRGIGLAIAELLARQGAAVALGARDGAEVERVAAELAAAGGRAVGVRCDVRRRADCDALVAAAVDAFGRLDVLVANAGVGSFGPVEAMTDDAWRAVIDTNLDGVFYCARAAIPHLKREGGWILTIGSLAGRNPIAGAAAYNATKFGLLGFTEALMLEVRHDGIRVACVMPGSVDTSFGVASPGSDWKLRPEDVAQVVTDLLAFPDRALPSRVEIRPSRPPK